ncbi:MAG: glycosyltransferase family 4 protein [Firmicutes bacterium]|nr:glycosyltransferase family 4 protein [Bacillota bacterium]
MNRPKMKILFVTYEYGKYIRGGIARVINGVSEQLRHKVDLDVLLNHDGNFMAFDLNMFRIKWHHSFYHMGYQLFQLRNEKLRRGHFRDLTAALAKLINREKYDIVHLFHNGEQAESVIKIIRRQFPWIKIVYSCHSIAKYDIAFRNQTNDQLEFENYIINQADHLHLLNRTSLKYLKESYPQTNRPVSYSIIPNGIEMVNLQAKPAHVRREIEPLLRDGGRIRVLCVSRWCYGKGLEYLLDAVPQVVASLPEARFILAGRKTLSWENGHYGYANLINKKIQSLREYVVDPGWLNDSERRAIFAHADIWVMPSLLEYFPYSILEPMAARIPIISARIDSVQEMLAEDKECLFYEPKDPAGLARQIVKLAKNAKLRGELARNAYQKAEGLYQWGPISEMYFKMYQDLIEGAPLPVF